MASLGVGILALSVVVFLCGWQIVLCENEKLNEEICEMMEVGQEVKCQRRSAYM